MWGWADGRSERRKRAKRTRLNWIRSIESMADKICDSRVPRAISKNQKTLCHELPRNHQCSTIVLLCWAPDARKQKRPAGCNTRCSFVVTGKALWRKRVLQATVHACGLKGVLFTRSKKTFRHSGGPTQKALDDSPTYRSPP